MAQIHSPPDREQFDDPAEIDPADLPDRVSHDVALFIQPALLQYTGSSTDEAGTGSIEQDRAYEQWYGLVDRSSVLG